MLPHVNAFCDPAATQCRPTHRAIRDEARIGARNRAEVGTSRLGEHQMTDRRRHRDGLGHGHDGCDHTDQDEAPRTHAGVIETTSVRVFWVPISNAQGPVSQLALCVGPCDCVGRRAGESPRAPMPRHVVPFGAVRTDVIPVIRYARAWRPQSAR